MTDSYCVSGKVGPPPCPSSIASLPFPGRGSSPAPQPAEKGTLSHCYWSLLCPLRLLISARLAPPQALGTAQEEGNRALLPMPKIPTYEAHTYPFTTRGSPDTSPCPPSRPLARKKAISLLTQALRPVHTPAWPGP